MIGIIGAMDSEVSALYELLQDAEITELYGYRFACGRLCGREVVLAKCGIGKVNAAVCTQTMIMKYNPEIIINSGVAGSLSPKLGICDIAVGSDVIQHDVDTTAFGDPYGLVPTVEKLSFECDENVRRAILDAAHRLGLNALPARIASGDQFISDGEKKKWIVDNFDAMACEMEGGAIAQVCYIAGVRCAIIRAISDSTDGNHAMEYEKFMQIAADNSVKVLLETLKSELF